MKKLLLILFLFYSFSGLRAQSAYIPFPSNMIIYAGVTRSAYPDPMYYTGHRIEVSGDTVIAGTSYLKLYSDSGYIDGVRNDTVNKKVYRYSAATGFETLWYDFDLSVGDTVKAADGYGFYDPMLETADLSGDVSIDTVWVSSVDSVMMAHDGLYHRRFNFTGKGTDYMGNPAVLISSDNVPSAGVVGSIVVRPLIEGVGQMFNPISNSGSGFHSLDLGHFCASINGVGAPNATYSGPPTIYGGFVVNGSLCESMFAGIAEVSLNDFKIFPNPTSGKIKIECALEFSHIEVVDMFGRKIIDVKTGNLNSEIDLSKNLAGVYFVRVTDTKGNSAAKKIIKY